MSRRREAPRFHPKFRKLIQALEIPEGKVLKKLDGHPVVISAPNPGEPLVNNQFTETQLRELADLVLHKRIGAGDVKFPTSTLDLAHPQVGWRLLLAHDAPKPEGALVND